MLLKVIGADGVKYVTACTVTATRTLNFFCHNEKKVESFAESLPFVEFQQRVVTLNARVKFPERAVREVLLEKEPSQATMASEPNSAGVWVLALKFVMDETPVPMKWEWHLKPMDTLTFYRQLLVDAIDVSHELHVIVQTLTKDICAKDKEIEQYRREGSQLRRTTVKTKPFDLVDFNDENKDLLEEVTSYNDVNHVFPCGISTYSHSREMSSAPTTPSTTVSAASGSGGTSNSPASTKASERPASSSSSAGYRSRKRRSRAINIERLERNIKQRMLNPHIEFNSQSSQEDNLAEWVVEGALLEAESKAKPVLDLSIKAESPQIPKAEAATAATVKTEKVAEPEKATTAPKMATVKTEKVAEPEKATTAQKMAAVKTENNSEPEKANTVLGEENNNDSLTESDQELNELRAILSASMAQKREKREK